LVIDEAQAMPWETIEALRLLTNLETEKRKLLQVVIFGQPELDIMMRRDDLRQLRQRIVFEDYLKPLKYSGVCEYVNYRMKTSGCMDGEVFTKPALWLLRAASGGVPRLINVLAHKSLMKAYSKGSVRVRLHHVRHAVKDTSESRGMSKFITFAMQASWFYTIGFVSFISLTQIL